MTIKIHYPGLGEFDTNDAVFKETEDCIKEIAERIDWMNSMKSIHYPKDKTNTTVFDEFNRVLRKQCIDLGYFRIKLNQQRKV